MTLCWRIAVAVSLALPLSACCLVSHCRAPEDRRRVELERLEQTVVELSKRMNAYLARNPDAASGFGAEGFFRAMASIDLSERHRRALAELRRYTVKVRPLPGGYYSMVVCDPRADGRKLFEDLSCLTTRVEIRSWDRPVTTACEFAPESETSCETRR